MFDRRSEPIPSSLERFRTVAILVVAIVGIEVVAGWITMNTFHSWEERAGFGDMFGAVNSLFSGLALAGVVYAILLQRQELALQRQELELTRHELERAANAQEESAELLRRQLSRAEAEARAREATERRSALPKLRVVRAVRTGDKLDFVLENYGAAISQLDIQQASEGARVRLKESDVVPTGGRLETVVEAAAGDAFSFTLVYDDILGRRKAIEISYDEQSRRLTASEPDAV